MCAQKNIDNVEVGGYGDMGDAAEQAAATVFHCEQGGGQCRVLCNPRDYFGRYATESTGFKDPLVIEI